MFLYVSLCARLVHPALRERKASFPRLTHTRALLLPRDITFYDEIGNISTSHLGFNNKNVIMTARPRYPLFGGWKTAFNVGYKVPFTSAVTAEAGEKYKLKVDFGVSFLNMTAVKHEIAIVLPEVNLRLLSSPLLSSPLLSSSPLRTSTYLPTYLPTYLSFYLQELLSSCLSQNLSIFLCIDHVQQRIPPPVSKDGRKQPNMDENIR
jgi:hypothetical protein